MPTPMFDWATLTSACGEGPNLLMNCEVPFGACGGLVAGCIGPHEDGTYRVCTDGIIHGDLRFSLGLVETRQSTWVRKVLQFPLEVDYRSSYLKVLELLLLDDLQGLSDLIDKAPEAKEVAEKLLKRDDISPEQRQKISAFANRQEGVSS